MKRMSKLFCIIAVMAMVVAMFAIPTSADVYEIKKGTPDVDGVLDDIYLDSAVYEYKAEEAFGFFLLSDKGGAKGIPINIDMNAYILYDNDYLYVCFVGYDDDPFPLVDDGEKATKEEIPYRNDHIAFFFTRDDVLEMVKTSFVAEFDISVATDGIDKADLITVGTMNDGHFVVEWAIPYRVIEGDILRVNIEMADRVSPEGLNRSSYGVRYGQGYDYCDEFFVTGEYAVAPSEAPAEEPEAPAEEPEAPAEEPEAPAEEPEVPAEEPEAPAEEPEAPAEEPEAPAEEPEAPAEEPEVPAEEPEAPAEEPEAPAEEPETPVEEPEVPAEEPEVPAEEPEVPDTFDASAAMYVLSAVSALGMGLVIRKRK